MTDTNKNHLENYPEEYITGSVTFFGRHFRITPDVLIPRLETEGLVRRARDIQKIANYYQIVDIGCGSGIIGTSLADLAVELIFLDISECALEIAKQNFRMHFPENKATFIQSNLLENFPNIEGEILFLANLPYIKGEDWGNMSSDTRYEPKLALFGGDVTGFELYERLFEQMQSRSMCGKLIIEFGFDQHKVAEEIIKKYGWKHEFLLILRELNDFARYTGQNRIYIIIL